MSNGAGKTSGVAGRYATALFELAQESGAFEAVSSQVDALAEALKADQSLAAALDDAVTDRTAMGRAVGAIADQMRADPMFRNFLGVMAAKRRLGALPATLSAFQALAAAQRGETTAEVIAAAPLTDAQRATLGEALSAASGAKVHMKVDVDPELIGGLIVKIGSKMIDASVRSKLANLQNALKGVG